MVPRVGDGARPFRSTPPPSEDVNFLCVTLKTQWRRIHLRHLLASFNQYKYVWHVLYYNAYVGHVLWKLVRLNFMFKLRCFPWHFVANTAFCSIRNITRKHLQLHIGQVNCQTKVLTAQSLGFGFIECFTTTFLHTHHSLLDKVGRWGRLMRMRLAWKKNQKTVDTSKILHQNETRSTGRVFIGIIECFTTTFLHTHHSLLAKLGRWGWLMSK